MNGRLIIPRRRFLVGAAAILAAPPIIRPASAQGGMFVGGCGGAGCGASGNAFNLIASTGVGSTGPAVVTTSGIDTTGADLLIISVSYYSAGFNNGPASAPVSDSYGNTWTGLTGRQNFIASNRIWYCRGGTVGAGHTFSLNSTGGSGSGAGSIAVQAWSGSNATPFDVQNGYQLNTGVTSAQTGSVTPSQDNSLIVAAGGIPDNTSAYGIDSGFTTTTNLPWSVGFYHGNILAYLKQNTVAAVNPTISWTGSASPCSNIAVFKP